MLRFLHAVGYLLKNTSVENLLSSLLSIQKGEAAISRSMTMRILTEFSHPKSEATISTQELQNLSPRELDILRELANGSSNGEIAAKLHLSVNTVKHHVHNILAKLNLLNRREVVTFARKHGLIKPSS